MVTKLNPEVIAEGSITVDKLNENVIESLNEVLKFVTESQLNHSINSRVFIGTKDEYDNAFVAGSVGTGALVIILDENEMENSTVTALLGTAILGKMLLGTN